MGMRNVNENENENENENVIDISSAYNEVPTQKTNGSQFF